jgi:hypothetical protein
MSPKLSVCSVSYYSSSSSFFLPPKVYPTHFSATTEWKSMKLIRNVKPIPIVLAYLVPLDVDVAPIKFHQFLFGK